GGNVTSRSTSVLPRKLRRASRYASGMPTIASRAVARTATRSDNHSASKLSVLMRGSPLYKGARGDREFERTARPRRSSIPRDSSARPRWRTEKSEASQDRLPIEVCEGVEERARKPGLSRAGDDGRGIDDRMVRVLRGTVDFLHLPGTRGGVGAVDEADLHLAARDVIQDLADVLRVDELALDPVPEPERAQGLLGILADGNRLGIADRDPRDARIRERSRPCEIERRVPRRHGDEDVARERAACRRNDQALRFGLVHLPGCRRDEHVDRRPGFDLLLQIAGRAEVV